MPKKRITWHKKLLLQLFDWFELLLIIAGAIGLFWAFQKDWPPDVADRKVMPTFSNITYKLHDEEEQSIPALPLVFGTGLWVSSLSIQLDMELEAPYETRYQFDTSCFEDLEVNGKRVATFPSPTRCGREGKLQYLGEYLHPGTNHIHARVRGGGMRFDILPVTDPTFLNANYRIHGQQADDFTMPLRITSPNQADVEVMLDMYIGPANRRVFSFDQKNLKELYVNGNKIFSDRDSPLIGDQHFDLSPYLHTGPNAVRAIISAPGEKQLLFSISPYWPKETAFFVARGLLALVILLTITLYLSRST